MGSARWDPTDWDKYTTTTKGKSQSAIFESKSLIPDFDPKNIGIRESVDSIDNPNSTPIIVALDVTGSMGVIPHQLIQGNLGTLMNEILDRKPVSDPHLMFMGVGDVEYDRAPLQATQFEADIRVAEQLRKIYIERGGGGNSHESYHLPWYFAAMKTSCDAISKRGKKGYLFTIGDEQPPKGLTKAQAQKVFGGEITKDFTTEELLRMAEENYHVFHIMVEQGSHFQGHGARVTEEWKDLLGQRAIPLSDYTKLAEVIVSTMQAVEGADRDHVAKSWSGDTSLVVSHALKGLTHQGDDATGLVVL